MTEYKQKQATGSRRIRGPNLAVLITRPIGVPFEEGLVRADAENRVFASNKRLGRALAGSEEWRGISEVFPCWSGTITAYVKPGEKLGKAVEHIDSKTGYRWVFPVPEEYRDKKDAILVAEHPNYDLETDGISRIVRAARVGLIEGFPAEEGWYLGDAQHGIPAGNSVNASCDARYLYRNDIRVGPVARGGFDIGWRGAAILLGYEPSVCFGVAVEAPEVPPENSRPPDAKKEDDVSIADKSRLKERIDNLVWKLGREAVIPDAKGTPKNMEKASRSPLVDTGPYMGVKFRVIEVKRAVARDKLEAFLQLDKAIGSYLHPESNEGNLSIRAADGFLIKRAGARLTKCCADDAVLVLGIGDDEVRAAGGTPSSESIMHSEIYKARADANIVLHFHSAELLERPGFAEVGPFPYGTGELAEAVGAGAKEGDIIKIREHGLVLIAKDVDSLLSKLGELIG